jgi:hypothetical protein
MWARSEGLQRPLNQVSEYFPENHSLVYSTRVFFVATSMLRCWRRPGLPVGIGYHVAYRM